MKITVEISDVLLRESRRIAAREGITIRSLIERGLRRVVAENRGDMSFKLRRASFKGAGLQADIKNAEMARDLIYKDRGAP